METRSAASAAASIRSSESVRSLSQSEDAGSDWHPNEERTNSKKERSRHFKRKPGTFKSTVALTPSADDPDINAIYKSIFSARYKQRIFKCLKCSKEFTSPYSARRHARVHLKGNEATCGICLLSLSGPLSLALHQKEKHNGQKKVVISRSNKETKPAKPVRTTRNTRTARDAAEAALAAAATAQLPANSVILAEKTSSGSAKAPDLAPVGTEPRKSNDVSTRKSSRTRANDVIEETSVPLPPQQVQMPSPCPLLDEGWCDPLTDVLGSMPLPSHALLSPSPPVICQGIGPFGRNTRTARDAAEAALAAAATAQLPANSVILAEKTSSGSAKAPDLAPVETEPRKPDDVSTRKSSRTRTNDVIEETSVPLPPQQVQMPSPCPLLDEGWCDPLTDVLGSLPLPSHALLSPSPRLNSVGGPRYTIACEPARNTVYSKSEERKRWEVWTCPSFAGLAGPVRHLPTSWLPSVGPAYLNYTVADRNETQRDTMKYTYVTSKKPIFSVHESQPWPQHKSVPHQFPVAYSTSPTSGYSTTPLPTPGPSTSTLYMSTSGSQFSRVPMGLSDGAETERRPSNSRTRQRKRPAEQPQSEVAAMVKRIKASLHEPLPAQWTGAEELLQLQLQPLVLQSTLGSSCTVEEGNTAKYMQPMEEGADMDIVHLGDYYNGHTVNQVVEENGATFTVL